VKDKRSESMNLDEAKRRRRLPAEAAWQLPSGEELAEFALRSGFMASGLMVISFAKNYLDSFQFNQIARSQGLGWINAIPVIGFNVFTSKAAELSAALVGWLSLWNAVGRMLIGWLSDRIGRRNAMVLDQGTTFVIMLLTPLFTGSAWMMLLMYLLIGLTYGGNLSVFPATNADWFGTKHVGVNYGIVFIGWGLAGVIGPLVGNFGVQALGGYRTGFVFAAILAVIAAFMSYSIKRPAVREEVEQVPAPA